VCITLVKIMTNTIAQLVNTDRYPVDDSEGTERSELIKSSREQIADFSGVQLEGFIKQDIVARLASEVTKYAAEADVISNHQNPYMTDENGDLPATHPARHYETWNSHSLCCDRIPDDSLITQLFNNKELLEFVRDCLSLKTLYHYRDPMVGYMVNLIYDGDGIPWHFDNNDFAISILLQVPEEGGVFEVAPNIRDQNSDNYEGVSAVLNDQSNDVVKLPANSGDLLIFLGRNSLHRVTKVRGMRPRYSLILGYTQDPHVIGTATRRLRHFGRCHQANRDYEASLQAK